MNKNFRIIQINGLSGILLLGFIITGLICGFVLFPIWVLMMGWNSVVGEIFKGPVIDYFQAVLLWSVMILVFYILLKNSISIRIQKEESFQKKDIREIIREIKEKEEIKK